MKKIMIEAQPYWQVDDGQLTWCEDPYLLDEIQRDYLDFEVIQWHTGKFTLAEVAAKLHDTEIGEGGLDDWWEVCKGTVYRNAEPICDLDLLESKYLTKATAKDSNKPVNRSTRRLLRHGCRHSGRKHVCGQEHRV